MGDEAQVPAYTMKGELCRDLILRRQLRSASRRQGKAETMVKAKEVLFNRSALAFRSPVQVQAKHTPGGSAVIGLMAKRAQAEVQARTGYKGKGPSVGAQ